MKQPSDIRLAVQPIVSRRARVSLVEATRSSVLSHWLSARTSGLPAISESTLKRLPVVPAAAISSTRTAEPLK